VEPWEGGASSIVVEKVKDLKGVHRAYEQVVLGGVIVT